MLLDTTFYNGAGVWFGHMQFCRITYFGIENPEHPGPKSTFRLIY